jgi:hypothetical protein
VIGVRRVFVVAGALLVSACRGAAGADAPKALAAPPRAAELLPADLDFVVRIDSDRLRAGPLLGPLLDELSHHPRSGLFLSFQRYLASSRAVWVGGRALSDGFRGDGVIVVEGSDVEGSPKEPGFVPVPSPRSDVETFESPSKGRGEPVLEVRCKDAVLFATAAEADAVLRVLRTSPDPDRLDPPGHGTVSFIGMVEPESAQGKDSTWRRLGRGLKMYRGSLDIVDDVGVELDLIYAAREQAAGAEQIAKGLAARLGEGSASLRTVADSARFTAREEVLGVRFRVTAQVLSALDLGSGRFDSAPFLR